MASKKSIVDRAADLVIVNCKGPRTLLPYSNACAMGAKFARVAIKERGVGEGVLRAADLCGDLYPVKGSNKYSNDIKQTNCISASNDVARIVRRAGKHGLSGKKRRR